jgi:hypothetical protein
MGRKKVCDKPKGLLGNNKKRGKAREIDNIRHRYENPLSTGLDPKYTTASYY